MQNSNVEEECMTKQKAKLLLNRIFPVMDKESDPSSSSLVGEVGRVLLSTSMLCSDAGVQATRQHFANLTPKGVLVPPSTSRSGILIDHRMQHLLSKAAARNGSSSTQQQQQQHANSSTTLSSSSSSSKKNEDIHMLRNRIRQETEIFLSLSGNNTKILSAKIEQLETQNRRLRKIMEASNNNKATKVKPQVMRDRWRTPKESEYDSDSSSVTSGQTSSVESDEK